MPAIRRRHFLGLVVGGLAGCSAKMPERNDSEADASTALDAGDAASPGTDAQNVDPCEGVDTTEMYDMNAQALYLDGTLGPLTGVIAVDYILAGEVITLEFWHGHNGQAHRFTLTSAEYDKLRRGERTYVTTTTIDGHEHMLFVDPTDPNYRVRGAQPVSVPVEEC